MDISKITYHRMEAKHLKDVQFLFKKVFNKNVTIDYLSAKYNTNYVGVSFLGTIAFDGEQPVAFYGALPQRFNGKAGSFLVAHACDSFTLQEYQGRGIHFQLAQLAYQLMRQHQVKMVYAFHSENTFHSTKKLDWLSHIHLQRFHIYIKTIPQSKFFRKIGLSDYFQRKIDRTLNSLKATSEISFNSDSNCYQDYQNEFYQYKNSIYPHFQLELEGCRFFCKVEAIMQIGFFTYPTIEHFKKAMESLKIICKKLGINEILFQVSPNSSMSTALKTITEPQQSWLVGYLPFEDMDITEFEFTFADLDTF
jgi:hypothetical protein